MKTIAIAVHTRQSGDLLYTADATGTRFATAMARSCEVPFSRLVSAHAVLTAVREARATTTDAATALTTIEATLERVIRGEQ